MLFRTIRSGSPSDQLNATAWQPLQTARLKPPLQTLCPHLAQVNRRAPSFFFQLSSRRRLLEKLHAPGIWHASVRHVALCPTSSRISATWQSLSTLRQVSRLSARACSAQGQPGSAILALRGSVRSPSRGLRRRSRFPGCTTTLTGYSCGRRTLRISA